MAYLTKGLRITFVDERDDREYTFYFEGGIVSFVRHLNKQPPGGPSAADLRRARR